MQGSPKSHVNRSNQYSGHVLKLEKFYHILFASRVVFNVNTTQFLNENT